MNSTLEAQMLKADMVRRQRDALDTRMGELGNLNALLQMVVWNAEQISADRDSEIAQFRDAVIGVGRAIDDVMKKDAYDLATGAA